MKEATKKGTKMHHDIAEILEHHPFEPSKIYYNAASRMGADGLTRTITVYWGKDAVTERTETFVATVKHSGSAYHNLHRGDVVFLWRSENLYTRGYTSSQGGFNGFNSNGATVLFHSDDEAARFVETQRHPNGTIVKSEEHSKFKYASERHYHLRSC